MTFRILSLRLQFVAREPLTFPAGLAANTLRGALGVLFKRLACRPGCSDARTCDVRGACPYAQVFEPGAKSGVPSGLSYWPRPFVFRSRHLDGRAIAAGSPFHFDLHLFTVDPTVRSNFIQVFSQLAREGLGPHRAKADLVGTEESMHVCDLAANPGSEVRSIRVEFLSPTELKHDRGVALQPEFPILFARIRDRLSTLRALYGDGPLPIDFRALGERAGKIRMTSSEVRHEEIERRSTRTGQRHSIGGLVGWAEYGGDLTEFVPYLEAARWTGVGRQPVWGKGEIALHYLSDV